MLGNMTNTNITANTIWPTQLCGQGTQMLLKSEKMREPEENIQTSHKRPH